jgi:hypothetical protein
VQRYFLCDSFFKVIQMIASVDCGLLGPDLAFLGVSQFAVFISNGTGSMLRGQ